MTTIRKTAPIAAAVLSALLAACGGGSGDSSTTVSSSSSAAASSTSSAASSTSSAGSSAASSSAASSAASSASSSSASVLTPANNATGAYIDTTLQITFDSAPTIGTSGYIYVYKSDGTLVDKISLNVFNTGSWVVDATASTPGIASTAFAYNTQTAVAANNTEVDRIGGNVTTIQSSSVPRYRWVFYSPITVSGNVATIKLHDGKLDYGTSYYVTMDSGVLSGTVGGSTFSGLSASSYAAATWKFTTKSAPSSTTAVTVAASGTSADFRTVQGALNWMMNNCAGTSTASCNSASVAKTITIADGTYSGMLWMNGVNNLTITGATRDGTIVTADNYDQYNPGTGGSTTLTSLLGSSYLGKSQSVTGGTRSYLGGGRATLLVESADLLTLNQFTLQNSHVKTSTVNNQAETIYYNSGTLTGSRLTATYMNFFSTQDTIQTKGWAWFYKSLIKGDVDFIWGAMFSAVFEDSELRTIVDTTSSTTGGYVTEARGAYGYPGIVILNSSLTKESGVPDAATYLSRQAGNFAGYCTAQLTTGSLANANYGCNNVAYINTKMGSHIATAGWLYSYTPTITTPTTAQGYRESGSMNASGATLDVSGRLLTYASTSLDLSGLNTRAKAFALWGTTDGTTTTATGWSPTAATCSSSACTTSK